MTELKTTEADDTIWVELSRLEAAEDALRAYRAEAEHDAALHQRVVMELTEQVAIAQRERDEARAANKFISDAAEKAHIEANRRADAAESLLAQARAALEPFVRYIDNQKAGLTQGDFRAARSTFLSIKGEGGS